MTLSRDQIERGRVALARMSPTERKKLVESLAVLHRRKAKRAEQAERKTWRPRNHRHGA